MRARRIWALLHGWLGAVSALFILLVSASGAALAFVDEMFFAQYGDVLRAEVPSADAAPVDLQTLIAASREAFDESFRFAGVLMPHSRIEKIETAMVFGLPGGTESIDDLHIVSVDPWTGAYKGDFLLRSAFGHEFIDFHFSLLFGPPGALFVSVLAVLLVALAATGFWMWWPRQGSAWRKASQPRLRGDLKQVLFILHGWFGIWLTLPIMFFTLTGLGLSQPSWFGPLLSAPTFAPPDSSGFERACDATVSPGDALGTAMGAVPGRALATFFAPNRPNGPYMLTFKADGDVNLREGDARVFVHGSCAGLVHVEDAQIAPLPAKTASMLLSLHGGYSFGRLLGDVLVLIAGLGLAGLAGVGVVVFFTRTLRSYSRNYAQPKSVSSSAPTESTP